MLGAAYGSVEDIEVLWTLIALFGLVFALSNVRAAYKDIRWVNTNAIGNGRRVMATGLFRGEIARVIKQFLLLLVGVAAMFYTTPNLADVDTKTAVINALIRWTLITVAALTTYQSYLAWTLRKEVQGDKYVKP